MQKIISGMSKKFLIGILIAIAFFIGLVVGNVLVSGGITGNVVSINQVDNNYTWTSAICDGENKCIDVLIECENGSVKNLQPMSDFVEFSEDWKDPRNDVDYCE